MSRIKILIPEKTNPVLEKMLSEEGFFVNVCPSAERGEILERIADYDAIVIRSKTLLDKEFIDAATRLRAIGRVGAGMDAIDVDYAESKGIVCFNSPEGNRTAVGEHAVGLLLALFDKIVRADSEVRHGQWNREKNRGLEIEGKTIGIIGYGNMGRSFAKRLSGFDCRVIAYDRFKSGFSDAYATEVSLEELQAQSEVLSLHVPLTELTRFMVDEAFIERFSHPFYLINTSRGKVVRLKDLLFAMQKGKVLGAGLDVLEFEAFSNELTSCELAGELKELFKREDIVFTPHVAGWSVESDYKLSFYLAQKLIRFFKAESSCDQVR